MSKKHGTELQDREEKQIEIRRMHDRDFEGGVILVTEFVDEALYEYGAQLDLEQIKATHKQVKKDSFVVVDGDKVVGILLGRVVKDFCSNTPLYEEILWYMNVNYRRYGMRLFKYVQQWCIIHGIKRMTMCCMHNSKTEKLFALYKKLGFREMETRFIKLLD